MSDVKIIQSTVLRNHLADAVSDVKRSGKYVLISRNGKIDTALIDVDLLEDLLAIRNKNYVKNIQKARRQVKTGRYTSFEQVFGKL